MIPDLAPSDLEGRAAQTTPNLHLKSGVEAEKILLEHGFINKGISEGDYTTFKHSDGSVITFNQMARSSVPRVDISDGSLKRPHTFPDGQEVIQ
jgi:hypothetical protein